MTRHAVLLGAAGVQLLREWPPVQICMGAYTHISLALGQEVIMQADAHVARMLVTGLALLLN